MTGIDVTLLRQAGLSEGLIEETIKKAKKEEVEAFKTGVLSEEPVKTFGNWLRKQEYPIKIVFTLPEVGGEIETRVSYPSARGGTGAGGKKQAIAVTTKQGGQETYPSYAEACRQLGLGDPSELNRSGKQMLDGAGVKYEITDVE
jgi:hypothetical protein